MVYIQMAVGGGKKRLPTPDVAKTLGREVGRKTTFITEEKETIHKYGPLFD